MTFTAAKEKLHDIIDHADEVRIFELLSLFEESTVESNYVFDDETLNMFKERSDEYESGKAITYTVEETMAYIQEQRKKHGI